MQGMGHGLPYARYGAWTDLCKVWGMDCPMEGMGHGLQLSNA